MTSLLYLYPILSRPLAASDKPRVDFCFCFYLSDIGGCMFCSEGCDAYIQINHNVAGKKKDCFG